ncbi:hypothetical protein [Kitasatospora sp. NPDC051914]|uniref:hypothetical protein n=1 Tax=Kitasatospora sp. NPDC051914 TaxID=3154945 RepID=UPI003446B029
MRSRPPNARAAPTCSRWSAPFSDERRAEQRALWDNRLCGGCCQDMAYQRAHREAEAAERGRGAWWRRT